MEKQQYIKTDDLGLIKFYSPYKQAFLTCIRDSIKELEDINYEDLKKQVNLEKIEKHIKIGMLLEKIYKETNDTITKEFIENWENKITKYNAKNIKKAFAKILVQYIEKKLSGKFEENLKDYLTFKDELIIKYNELENNLKIRDAKIKDQEKIAKQNNKEISLAELLEDDLGYIRAWNEKIMLENRIYTINKEVKETTQEIESYYYLENKEEKEIINEFVKRKVEQIYNGKTKEYKFKKSDYELLIDQIKGLSNLMPATITLVSSEIKDIAKKQGITIEKIEYITFVKIKNNNNQ